MWAAGQVRLLARPLRGSDHNLTAHSGQVSWGVHVKSGLGKVVDFRLARNILYAENVPWVHSLEKVPGRCLMLDTIYDQLVQGLI